MSRMPTRVSRDGEHPSVNAPFKLTTFRLEGESPALFCSGCGGNMHSFSGYEVGYGDEVRHWAERVYANRDRTVLLCSHCADAIANYHYESGGGEWLSWPNPPKPINPRDKWKIRAGLRRDVYERDEYRCRYCGVSKDLGVDHLIPITQEGCTNDLDNLVTCCKSCNSRKGSRTPAEAGMAVTPEPGQVAS